MEIAVLGLASGRHRLSSVAPPASYGRWISDSGLVFCGDIAVDVVLDKMSEEVYVRAVVKTTVKVTCARCLDEVVVPVEGEFGVLYMPIERRDLTGPASHREESESQRVQYYAGGVVDLGGPVVEAIQLALPMKPLCSPGCRGICGRCGANLNREQCGCPGEETGHHPFRGLFGGS